MRKISKNAPPASARLFSDTHAPGPPAGVHIANIDGASRGNPGPASYAVVIRDPSGKTVLELAKRLGRETNNVAEYYALLAALDYAASNGITALRIRSDSELLVRQMQGRYKVKSPELKPLYERASKIARQIAYFTIEHVRREQNKDADALANVALDSGPVTSVATTPGGDRKIVTDAPGKQQRARKIRARFANGVLVPSEPLDLTEGSEVILDLHVPTQE
jgi:ribonuclease HI